MSTIEKLLQLNPTRIEEVHATLEEAISELRSEAEQKLATLDAQAVKEIMLTVQIVQKAARDVENLEAEARKIMQRVCKQLKKQISTEQAAQQVTCPVNS